MTPSPAADSTSARQVAGGTSLPRGYGLLLTAALLLTGLSMRTAVTSVGSELDALQPGLQMSGAMAGLVTTLPAVCFMAIGGATPTLVRRVGEHRLIVLAMLVMTAGLLARAVVHTAWAFTALSVPALAGGAIANVLMPTLVKRHFPDRIGGMTAVYTTAMALGTTMAAGLTVPIGELGDGWRTGIGSWALLSLAAIIPWLPTLRHDQRTATRSTGVSMTALVRSRTAWAVTILFASQSFQAYIGLGWFAKFFSSQGYSLTTAGVLSALFAAVQIPVSMAAPNLVARWPRQLILTLVACGYAAYVGMILAPVSGAWLWMVLAGAAGGLFPTSLTLIGLRARNAETTAALSAFVQAVGYIIAATGPLLFGILHGATNEWHAPLTLLLAAMTVTLLMTWTATAHRYVDDEISAGQ